MYTRVIDYPVAIVSKKSKSGHLVADALTIEQIMPYKKWRIVYNGLAKIHKADNPIDCNLTASCDEMELQHVMFTFLYDLIPLPFFQIFDFGIVIQTFEHIFSWNAASDPLSWPKDWNSDLLLQFLNTNDDKTSIAHQLSDL